MRNRHDRVDIPGVAAPTPPASDSLDRPPHPRAWLGILFNCCHTYGRIYRNREGTEYVGRCPACGHIVRAGIGPGGSSRRIFETS